MTKRQIALEFVKFFVTLAAGLTLIGLAFL